MLWQSHVFIKSPLHHTLHAPLHAPTLPASLHPCIPACSTSITCECCISSVNLPITTSLCERLTATHWTRCVVLFARCCTESLPVPCPDFQMTVSLWTVALLFCSLLSAWFLWIICWLIDSILYSLRSSAFNSHCTSIEFVSFLIDIYFIFSLFISTAHELRFSTLVFTELSCFYSRPQMILF